MSSPNFPTIDRRAFLGGLGLSILAAPIASEAQSPGRFTHTGRARAGQREANERRGGQVMMRLVPRLKT
jgi:hypothetical protein